MRPGEIYLARFPFGDVPGMKLRPVLLLTESLGSVPEVLVAYISSVLPVEPLPSDRMLVAQAQLEDIPIVSRDRVLDAGGVTRLW